MKTVIGPEKKQGREKSRPCGSIKREKAYFAAAASRSLR
jgi:hypothetical protein